MMSTIFTKQLGRMASSNVNGPRPLWWRSVWSIQIPTSAKAGPPGGVRWSGGRLVGEGRCNPFRAKGWVWFFSRFWKFGGFWFSLLRLVAVDFLPGVVVVVCRNILEVGCWCCTSKAFNHLLVGIPEGGWLWISNWWRLECFQDVISADFGKNRSKVVYMWKLMGPASKRNTINKSEEIIQW